MRIHKRMPYLIIRKNHPIASVWVSFPFLPLVFFNKKVLLSIASYHGTPLKIGEPTACFSRPKGTLAKGVSMYPPLLKIPITCFSRLSVIKIDLSNPQLLASKILSLSPV
ncbi:hypothetical protein Fot_18863 [Forsythia ovata]|uniref:DUF4283 domain-containing protein n=1 Tax=Forsythia ovata TaxID=205694 RepID=A0ABD1VJS8_9LAMI